MTDNTSSDIGTDVLSDYEKRRLRNIKRNEERLTALGLLRPTSVLSKPKAKGKRLSEEVLPVREKRHRKCKALISYSSLDDENEVDDASSTLRHGNDADDASFVSSDDDEAISESSDEDILSIQDKEMLVEKDDLDDDDVQEELATEDEDEAMEVDHQAESISKAGIDLDELRLLSLKLYQTKANFGKSLPDDPALLVPDWQKLKRFEKEMKKHGELDEAKKFAFSTLFMLNHPKYKTKDKSGIKQDCHHLIPVSLGGSNDNQNLVYLSQVDHLKAHIALTCLFSEWEVHMATTFLVRMYRKQNEDEFEKLLVEHPYLRQYITYAETYAVKNMPAREWNHEPWKEMYNKLVDFQKKFGHCYVASSFHDKKLVNWVKRQRSSYKFMKEGEGNFIIFEHYQLKKLRKIGFDFEPNETLWKQRLKELKAYKKMHGDCLVPTKYKQNAKLGRWVDTQRVQYKRWLNGVHSPLTQDRIDQLNEIDFVWDVDNALWKQRLKELKVYKKKHGDCLVPYKYEHNGKLGIWVAFQRVQYKKWLREDDAFISQERIDELNKLDFVWEVGGGVHKDDTVWKQHLKELKAYKQKHGDCLVSRNYEPNKKLGSWVKRQRYEYKKWLREDDAFISQERIDQLNKIEFVWEVGTGNNRRDDMLWKQQFNELVKYKEKHGDCLVPQKYKHNAKLGNWVGKQRVQYKKWLRGEDAPITQDRIDQLEDIGFVWEVERYQFQNKPNDTLWKQQFNELVKYKKKHGDRSVPKLYKNSVKLGNWVKRQRREYKKWLKGEDAPITQERIDQLEGIDFVWEVDKRF